MTTPLRRASRLRARLGRLGRAVTAFRWRRAMASRAPSTRFARNGPVTIAYDVRGRGAPLVLIQGVGIGRWGWEPVADRLARRFQVITIDNRGVGASDSPPGHFTTRSMAKYVPAVLDHADVERASVLGTSLGGMIAQELALTQPERVDRLVLVATLPGGPRSRHMPLGTTYLLASAPFLTGRAKLERFVNTTLGPTTLRRRPEIAERLAAAKLAHPQSEPAWRAQTAAGMLFNPLGQQRRVAQPTPGRAGHRRPGRGPRQRSRAGWPASECPSGALRRGGPPALLGAAQTLWARGDRLPHRPGHACTRVEPNRPPGQLVDLNQGARR
jgi:pimeloyl-ACP methyl ester carboxylesterase